MPKRIENYLTEGLPSKIYYYAFPKPISRYAIANLLHGKPVTSHISVASREMINKGYLIEDSNSKQILSNVAPLVAEIEKDLKTHQKIEIELTDTEKVELTNFLDNQFREIVAEEKLPEGDVNAYYILINTIGIIACMKRAFAAIPIFDDPKSKQFLQIMFGLGEKEYEELKESRKKAIEIPLSDSLLEKLEAFAPEEAVRLWNTQKETTALVFEGIKRLAENHRKEKLVE